MTDCTAAAKQPDYGGRHHHRQQQERGDQPLERERPVQHNGNAETDDHLTADRNQHVFGGDREIAPDVGARQQVAIVLQADEDRRLVAGSAVVVERRSQRVDQRKNIEDDQEGDRWQDKKITDRDIGKTAGAGRGVNVKLGDHFYDARLPSGSARRRLPLPPGAAVRLFLTVSLVLVERLSPIGFDAVERLLGRSLAADDVGIER